MNKKFESFLSIAFLLPSFGGVSIFVLYPLCQTISISFFKDLESGHFVGLNNYLALLSNKMFVAAVNNSMRFYLIALPLIILLPLLFAIMISKTRIASIFDKAIYTSILIPSASLMIFIDLLFDKGGVISGYIMQIFDISAVSLYNSEFAFVLLIALYIFKYGGFNYLIFSVALTRIPSEYYEEAELDGAKWHHCLWYITLPQLLPVIIAATILSLLNSYKIYREAFLIGGYYPHDSIYMIQHFINNNFLNLNYNRLACVTVLILSFTLILAIVAWATYRILRRAIR